MRSRRSAIQLAVGELAVGFLLVAVLAVPAGAASYADNRTRASRADRGDLMVLDLYGSYEDMGREEAELLGPMAAGIAEIYADRWQGLVRSQGVLGWFVNALVLPFWSSAGGWREDSGFFEKGTG